MLRRKAAGVGRAFTLLELITVVAIISLLAGVIVPIVSAAKKSSHESACISNLRQCTFALLMYGDSYDGLRSLPNLATAANLLSTAPTCDSEDYFRNNCSAEAQPPLVGSYGYIRGLSGLDTTSDWDTYLAVNPSPYLLACSFYGSRKVYPYSGNDLDPCVSNGTCYFPTQVVRSLPDGSAQTLKMPSNDIVGPGYHPLFTWDAIFGMP